MSINKKRKLPPWMKKPADSDIISSTSNGINSDISPRLPDSLSALNHSVLNNSQIEHVKENTGGNAQHMRLPAEETSVKCVADNVSDSEEDDFNNRTSTDSQILFTGKSKDQEDKCEPIKNSEDSNASVELNTVKTLPSEETEDQTDRLRVLKHTPSNQNNAAEGGGSDSETSSKASVSTPPATRRSCYYGSSCYRKNPQHRREFAHPGDTEYCDSSTSNLDTYTNTQQNSVVTTDDRPLCEYGSACYRKNPQHRRDFRHDSPKKRNARPADLQDIPSDDDGDFNSGSESDTYNPGESETDDSFVTSDSASDGNSDYDPEQEETPPKRKKKQANKKRGVKRVKKD